MTLENQYTIDDISVDKFNASTFNSYTIVDD